MTARPTIDVGEIDPAVFKAALVSAAILPPGAELPPEEAKLLSLAVQLGEAYEKEVDDEHLLDCDRCGGVSPDSLTVCPYCGDVDTDQTRTEKTPPKETTVNDTTNPKSTALATSSPREVAQVVATPPKRNADLETNTGTTGLVGSEKKLDQAVQSVHEMKASLLQSTWQLGHKIRTEIFERQLWKFRTKEDGKPAFTTFDQFCRQELGIGVTQAYKWMDVSAEFTEADCAQVGVSKLGHLLGLPPATKAKLLEEAKKGASSAAIANAAKKERGSEPRTTSRGAQSPKKAAALQKATNARVEKAAAAKKAPAPETAGRITVAQIEGKKTIKLYAKPATGKKNVDLSDLKRAKRVGDQPFGVFDLANGVRQWIEVRANAGGELELVIETRRHEG